MNLANLNTYQLAKEMHKAEVNESDLLVLAIMDEIHDREKIIPDYYQLVFMSQYRIAFSFISASLKKRIARHN